MFTIYLLISLFQNLELTKEVVSLPNVIAPRAILATLRPDLPRKL